MQFLVEVEMGRGQSLTETTTARNHDGEALPRVQPPQVASSSPSAA
jgi:hypothetical protein